MFSANEVIGSSKFLQRDESPCAGLWWHLIWEQACAEVRKLLANEDCLGADRDKEELQVLEQSSSDTGQKLQVRLQKYTKTMLKSSQFKTAEDENQRCEGEPKRLKVEP